jgi:hypothetical protein
MPGHQAGEAVPAGDEHEALGRTGQEQPYLVRRVRVVQQDQHPPAGHEGAVPGGPLGEVVGDVLPGGAERPQEGGQHVGRLQRLVGVVAAEVGVQLPVGELVGDAVCPVHRERRLADPAGTGDRGDHDGRGMPVGRGEQRIQCGKLRRPSGEAVGVQRQLPRHDRLAGRFGLRLRHHRLDLGRDQLPAPLPFTDVTATGTDIGERDCE